MEYSQTATADALLAINAAKSFFNLAGSFFGQLPSNPREWAEFISSRKGPLIAATANLAFLIELYLKATAKITLGHAPHGHNLLKLFDELPEDIRQSIDGCYRYRCSCLKSKLLAIEFTITTTPIEPTAEQKRPWRINSVAGDDVRSLLEAEQDAFQIWRYLYEAHAPDKPFCVVIHHARMAVLKDAIEDQSKPSHERPNFASK